MVETENDEFKGSLFNPEDLMKEIPTLMETLGHERDQLVVSLLGLVCVFWLLWWLFFLDILVIKSDLKFQYCTFFDLGTWRYNYLKL